MRIEVTETHIAGLSLIRRASGIHDATAKATSGGESQCNKLVKGLNSYSSSFTRHIFVISSLTTRISSKSSHYRKKSLSFRENCSYRFGSIAKKDKFSGVSTGPIDPKKSPR
jgi:hypothetical protein